MRNRLLISTLVHFLLGILFVFPVYSAEDFEFNKVRNSIGYYGSEAEDEDDSEQSIDNNSHSGVKALTALKELGISSFLPVWVCERDSGSKLLLKFSQQIVDISFLKCIRSVVIRC